MARLSDERTARLLILMHRGLSYSSRFSGLEYLAGWLAHNAPLGRTRSCYLMRRQPLNENGILYHSRTQ